MPTEDAICVTKESVKAMIGILNQTIDILHKKGSKVILTDEEYSTINDAKRELETYKEVKKIMDEKGHITLCLMTSGIKKKGHVKVYIEKEEEEQETDWSKEEQEKFEYYTSH